MLLKQRELMLCWEKGLARTRELTRKMLMKNLILPYESKASNQNHELNLCLYLLSRSNHFSHLCKHYHSSLRIKEWVNPINSKLLRNSLPQPLSKARKFERPKRKGKKRVGKRVEPQPLVGMFNDTLGRYDSPVSIRQVLQNNKVDMTWMDLVAWSPAVCKELKRLCTRVAKKRMPKVSSQPQQQQGSLPQS